MPDFQHLNGYLIHHQTQRRLSEKLAEIGGEQENVGSSNESNKTQNISLNESGKHLYIDYNDTFTKQRKTRTDKIQLWLTNLVNHKIYFEKNKEIDNIKPAYREQAIGDEIVIISEKDIDDMDDTFKLKSGLIYGEGEIKLKDGTEMLGSFRNSIRTGRGIISGGRLGNLGIKHISGHYNKGVLQGRGEIEYLDGLVLEGDFHEGYLEGVVIGHAVDGTEQFSVCCYKRGIAVGVFWRRFTGGGWLNGVLEKETGDITGDNIMYIYPDLRTCLVGKFVKGEMVEGRQTTVEDVVEECQMMRLIPAKPDLNSPIFSYLPSDDSNIRVNWQQRDFYESRWVECRPSHMEQAGEGLFALEDIPSDTVVSFYHGLYYSYGELSPQDNYDYQIYLDWVKAPISDFLDIPSEAWSVSSYCASLGHKVNHSFQPNCQYSKFYHPVFGRTCCAIRTTCDIKKGEELFCSYRYDPSDCPEWYYNLYCSD